VVSWASLPLLVRIELLLRRQGLFAFFISEVLARSNVLAAEHAYVLSCLISSECSLDSDYLLRVFLEVLVELALCLAPS
jgi:hypothetical protein